MNERSMNGLRSQLEAVAESFISGLLAAMNVGPLGELADGSVPRSTGTTTGGRRRVVASSPNARASRAPALSAGRRKRASAGEVQEQKAIALAAAKSLKPGFSKGDIMKKSGGAVDLGRALSLLVADGKLSKKGDRRSTRYSLK